MTTFNPRLCAPSPSRRLYMFYVSLWLHWISFVSRFWPLHRFSLFFLFSFSWNLELSGSGQRLLIFNRRGHTWQKERTLWPKVVRWTSRRRISGLWMEEFWMEKTNKPKVDKININNNSDLYGVPVMTSQTNLVSLLKHKMRLWLM